MSNVFANGLEISGKAVDAKTIAAFPDVCFTPPENPATPPGVPVPYPSFGFSSDTEQGTGTVKIGGKTVNIKNKSDLTKTSGTEAGCAAKKGVITSKNTGKEYFNSWSNNVKFDGEPVIRMTDLATNNHASPTGNTPPWLHIAELAKLGGNCEAIYVELDGHPHSKSPCDTEKTGRNSEHTTQVACYVRERGKTGCGQWPAYKEGDAPCICMNTRRVVNKKKKRRQKEMPHDRKGKDDASRMAQRRTGCKGAESGAKCDRNCSIPKTGDVVKDSSDASAEHHERTKRKPQSEKDQISECLTLINLAYLGGVKDGDTPEQAQKKIDDVKQKPVCGKGVCKAPKAKPCIGCGV